MKVLEVSSLDEVKVAVRAERTRQGLTQQQLEDLSGVSKRTICSLETGRFFPHTEVMLDVIKALGYDEIHFKLRK